MKRILVVLLLCFAVNQCAWGQLGWDQSDSNVEDIQYQLYTYDQLTSYLDDLFKEFSEGYMQPEIALKKVNVLKHEYNKLVEPVPEEAEKFHDLVNVLLSRIENYFIYWKRANRENPEINIKIAKTKFELANEEAKLRSMYGE